LLFVLVVDVLVVDEEDYPNSENGDETEMNYPNSEYRDETATVYAATVLSSS
jgi:hypothetical protein